VGSAGIGEWGVDLPVTVATAALVPSPLVGEGAVCIAQIRHNIYVELNNLAHTILRFLFEFGRGARTKRRTRDSLVRLKTRDHEFPSESLSVLCKVGITHGQVSQF
jgi:hypothetical protein